MHLNATILHADNLSEQTHLLLQTYLYNINVQSFHLTNLPALCSFLKEHFLLESWQQIGEV